MADYEKVAKGLEWILEDDKFGFGKGVTKPECDEEKAGCFIHDALELIKCQRETIDELISADKALKVMINGNELLAWLDELMRDASWYEKDEVWVTLNAVYMHVEHELEESQGQNKVFDYTVQTKEETKKPTLIWPVAPER